MKGHAIVAAAILALAAVVFVTAPRYEGWGAGGRLDVRTGQACWLDSADRWECTPG